VKSLGELAEQLLLNCGSKGGAAVFRDVHTLRERTRHEGDGFITITLPNFCSDFERCLAEGRVVPGLFLSFRKEKSGIPSFLKGFLHHVFGPDGSLRSNPSILHISLIRQICLYGKKILRPCSPSRTQGAIERFISVDKDCVVPEFSCTWTRVFRLIVDSLAIVPEGDSFLLRPRHGPGATTDRLIGNAKWTNRTWTERLEQCGYTFHRSRFGRDEPLWDPQGYLDPQDQAVYLSPECEPPVKVVLVPKTQKSPRVIAIESTAVQYAQQGLKAILVDAIENSDLTAGHVIFDDQLTNQILALEGSMSGRYATVDLSDASDRISLGHIRALFQSMPKFLEWIEACRTARAVLPGGEVIALRKFASMGSALTFPLEALMFFSSIVASRLEARGIYPTVSSVREYGQEVYVYGDDLIFPADEAPAICADLEAHGFKVNRRKSFWTGKFRESCGADAYDGELVTPTYLRRDLPADRSDASGILSTVAVANHLEHGGLFNAAAPLRKRVEQILGRLPKVSPDSPAIGWWSHSEATIPSRWNKRLHRVEYRCWSAYSTRVEDPLEGSDALAKCFLLLGSPDPADWEHLEYTDRPYGLTLRRRWTPYPL
jgi:hypothetical protein